MAKMYPKLFPNTNNSDAEKAVFKYFDKEAPADWIVLHSFRLPEHYEVVFGESDFIVIAPNLGVFILEVKGGGVGYDGTYWRFINRKHEITEKTRGPFEQARSGMFVVEKIIKNILGSTFERMRILYGYGVIFTDEYNFPVNSITEDEPWRLIQNNVPKDYTEFIKRLEKNFRKELQSLNKRQPRSISKEEAEAISKALRPEIGLVPPLKSFIENSEDDVIALTQKQYECLIDVEMNNHVVVQGGAGTGKTVLALEDARRTAEQNKRVLFLCFNVNLAKELKQRINNDLIELHSFHSYLMKICKDNLDGTDTNNDDFFSTVLPSIACNVLDNSDFKKFDKLIVDECQDLCTKEYLECFDRLLDGGLVEGRFSFYGDFARQAIYNKSSSLDLLQEKALFISHKRLTVNCRNTKNIGNELINVTGYEDKYYLLTISGEPVEYFSWASADDEKQLLKQTIKELNKRGILSKNIMVLSPRTREKSIINEYDKDKTVIGNYCDDPQSYFARFSTVQAFKGLESEVVILVDVESYDDSRLMYVGFSRARSKMIVLESETAAKRRKALTIRR